MAAGLQVLHNIGQLGSRVRSMLDHMLRGITKAMQKALDVQALNRELKGMRHPFNPLIATDVRYTLFLQRMRTRVGPARWAILPTLRVTGFGKDWRLSWMLCMIRPSR